MARIERGVGLGGVLVRVLAVLFLLIGLTLAIGGGWLLSLGGSFYYLLAGLGLIASAVRSKLRASFRRRRAPTHAHTAKATPSTPSIVVGCAPSRS